MDQVKHKVVTKRPHAAVLVWNYLERLGINQSSDVNAVEPVIISTVSLMSVSTNKSKSNPVGRFELRLAPTKNWVSTLTPGSWLCILMSQTPITENDLPGKGFASPDKVKMIGKIESVRAQVNVNQETGARQTTYAVTGIDWGYIFENKVYIDPFLDPSNNLVGSATYLEIFKLMKGKEAVPSILPVDRLIRGVFNIIGKPLSQGFEQQGEEINRIAKATYSFKIPKSMVRYLRLAKGGERTTSDNLADLVNFYNGKLTRFDNPADASTVNPYTPTNESSGYIDPLSLKGTNSLWQVMTDNSNPVINEMLTDMRWGSDGNLSLALYNRVKPFVFKKSSISQNRLTRNIQESISAAENASQPIEGANKVRDEVKRIVSEYKNIRRTKIPLEDVVRLDVGTNWRDKYNFVEIKPSFQDFDVLGTWVKTVAQSADTAAFAREGFRPLIMSTKQFPTASVNTDAKSKNKLVADLSYLAGWKELLKIWHFDTHKMLNGTVEFSGQSNYIQVGDNIMFSVRALGITPNITVGTDQRKAKEVYILAHVENINHNFSVSQDGARTFMTSVQFVRGIVVNENGETLGEGTLDSNVRQAPPAKDLNSVNTFGTSGPADPDPQKLKGS